MKDKYEMFQNGDVIGEASIERKGLYYEIKCSCTPNSDEIHRVILSSGEQNIDLGICIPKGNRFCLEKTISIKRVGTGPFSFRIEHGVRESAEEFAPVSGALPFPHICKLENARFERRGGKAGIWIIP